MQQQDQSARGDKDSGNAQQGVVRDQRGQEQPADKRRAQQSGLKTQKDAAQTQPPFPGEPAGGE